MRGAIVALAFTAVFSAAASAAADGLSDLAFRPNPGAPLPLAVVLKDEQGRAVPVGWYFTGEPVVLVLQYLRCRTLCGLTLRNVIDAVEVLPLRPGRDFRLLAIDIDPHDTPADALRARQQYLGGRRNAGAEDGIHFLTGEEAVVRAVADAVGFPFRYDAATEQYLHPAGFIVATPDGTVSRYFFGIGASPAELQQGLADAAAGNGIGPLARFLLLCRGDGATGRYTLAVLAVLTAADLGAAGVVVALFAVIRRRRRR